MRKELDWNCLWHIWIAIKKNLAGSRKILVDTFRVCFMDFAKSMLNQAEPFFLIFQKSDAQNVISLLNEMDGCLANIISMMFILEVVWPRSMKNMQNAQSSVASKWISRILIIRYCKILIYFSKNGESTYATLCFMLSQSSGSWD